MTVVVKVKVIRRSCFAMELRESARHLSGKENYSWGRGERELMITNCDFSSLVVDRLCDHARGQNTAATCFYFDFSARKEQSAIGMPGSLLKQVVCGMEEIPEEISWAIREQKMDVGGRGPLKRSIQTS